MKIFIVGFWHCGTSILAKLIDQHEDIKIIRQKDNKNFEMSYGGFVVNALNSMGYSPITPSIVHAAKHGVKQLEVNNNISEFKKIIEHGFGDGNKAVKMNHYIVCKNLLDEVFPDSKRIIIVRNSKSFSISKNENCVLQAKMWVEYMKLCTSTWFKDSRTLILRYENLCANPQKELSRVFEYLNVKNVNIKLTKKVSSRNWKWNKFKDQKIKKQIEEIVEPTEKILSEIIPYN